MSGETLAEIFLVASRLIWYGGIVSVLGACALRVVLASTDGPARAAAERTAAATGLAGAAILVVGTFARLFAQAYDSFGIEEPLTADLVWIVATDLPPWSTGWQLQLVTAVAALAVFVRARSRRPPWRIATVVAAAIAATAPLTGHAVAQSEGPLLPVAVQAAHVLGAGAWIGGLFVLALPHLRRRAQGNPSGSAVATAVEAFSPLALTSAGLLALSGAATLFLYLEAISDLWTTTYGRTLLAKLAFVAAVAAAGFVNWRVIRPRLLAGGSPAPLRRSATIELALAAVVLVLTAVLVGLPQPGEH
ncbi:MAG TPA: CopD family protein [Vicinamibacterales bacterium]|nr:CopD family protein [Vicinamibacterales bacterium]